MSTKNNVLFDGTLVKGFTQLHGKVPNMVRTDSGNRRLNIEIIKEMLRKGRPVIVDVVGGGGYWSHSILCIGFTTENGKTTFQSIDSNRLHIDNGYRTDAHVSSGTCIWIE